MQYKITKQFGTGRETPDRNFTNLNEAKAYSQQSAESDASMKINTIYRVYEFDDVVHEVNSAKIELSNPSAEPSNGSSSGKGSGSTFNPTPFAVSAKPKGAVQHWKKDEEDNNKK